MYPIRETALQFFTACESGQGWEACRPYCHDDASFDVQAESLAGLKTVAAYSDSIPALLITLPDAHYELQFLSDDQPSQTVVAYALFRGTHTGPNGPVAPTGRQIDADYAFVMRFSEGKIARVTKIWNDAYSARQLGWG